MDTMSREKRSRVMRAIRSCRTGPELKFGIMLLSADNGFTYFAEELGARLPEGVKPDFVNHKTRTAVFVHGCFWHGCPRHYTRPKTHMKFWDAKLVSNRKRDARAARRLKAAGWVCFRVWECQVGDRRVAQHCLTAILGRR